MSFSEKKVGESVLLGFDMVRLLGVGEQITAASFSVSVLRGVDADPSAMKDGAATISGAQVKQRIKNGVAGCYYTIEVAATTNAGNIYIERGTLEVIA